LPWRRPKEDYGDVARHPGFAGRPVLAYNAPGCGETSCPDLTAISIPFLVKTAQAALDQAGIDRFRSMVDLSDHGAMWERIARFHSHETPD
jgi:pimeloyl-ACP methyl ester carboxylesterase